MPEGRRKEQKPMQMLENKAQEEAIDTIDGQLLIVACPGSGKTTTLIRRIANMVGNGIPGKNILMMTFSRAAAKEMSDRFMKEYGYMTQDVTFCTIHSFCFAIMRHYMNFSSDCIISDHEIYTLFRDRLKKYRTQLGSDYTDFVKRLMLDIGNIKNTRTRIEDFTPTCTKLKWLFAEMYDVYEKYKQKVGKIDFDDMLILALDFLKKRPDIVQKLHDQYQYIQVDEYQDTNIIQAELIYLIAGKHGNLAVVGDDDQSIYAFRAATPEIMMSFTDEYPDAKVVKMGTNYRSKDEIIEPAGNVIKHNKDRFDKEFIGCHGEGGEIHINGSPDTLQEVKSAVQKISMLAEDGEKLSDIAVLFRNNVQAELIAQMLAASGLPFKSTEKVKSRYEGNIFNDIMDFHTVANSAPGDSISNKLYSILCKPVRYFKRGIADNGLDKEYMRRFVVQSANEQWQADRNLEELEDFFYYIDRLKTADPAQSLNIILRGLRYEDYLADYADFRNEDLDGYLEQFDQFRKDIKDNDIRTWLQWREFADRSIIAFEKQHKKSGEAVTISTMHKAKGLEWKTVFLQGCRKDIIPGKNSISVKGIEEERRLFYVAMTRAKEALYISYSGYRQESPFIKEVYTLKKDNNTDLGERLAAL